MASNEALIYKDHERAQTYHIGYLADMNGEFYYRGLILTGAMNKYNTFLGLPLGDSRGSAMWDFAFNLLAMAVPLLRIGKFVTDLQKSSSVALAMATLAGKKAKMAKVVNVVAGGASKAGKGADKINDAKDKIQKITDPAAKLAPPTPRGEVERLDVSKRIIADLIADSKKATASYKDAIEAELLEFENRLDGMAPSGPGSLDSFIRTALPPVPVTSEEELDQIGTLYLWTMIGQYCVQNVQIVQTTTISDIHTVGRTQVHSHTTTKIVGLNNTQQAELVELFGLTKKRGRWFNYPPIQAVKGADVYLFLALNNIKPTVVTNHEQSFSETMK